MSRSSGPLARLRPVAGPLLLALFVLSAQFVPALHLATHRAGHTHGPGLDDHDHAPTATVDGRPAGDDDADADPRADAFAGHVARGRPAPPASPNHEHQHAAARAETSEPDHHHAPVPAPDPAPDPAPGAPSSDHGRGSSAHFGLALIDGPPPLFIPPPPATLALPPDVAPRATHTAPLPQPPARGPPSLA